MSAVPILSAVQADGLAYWHAKGAPLNKLLLGTPFYGRSFTLRSTSDTKPGAPSSGPGQGGEYTEEPGFLAYYEVCRKLKEETGWTEAEDSDGNPYIFKVNPSDSYQLGESPIFSDSIEHFLRKLSMHD